MTFSGLHDGPEGHKHFTSSIVATRRRDETIKRHLYERSGVAEYWVVDPDTDVVRVYRQGADRFDRAVELTREAGDVLTTPLLPGLDLPLERIFRD